MKKRTSIILYFMIFTLLLIPNIIAHADTEMVVRNEQELKDAIENREVTTITLGSDIETNEKINITRALTINGNNHEIKYVGTFGSNGSQDNTVWGGIYVLQVYRTTATIKNIKLTGANAALLVNGSKVNLEGTIDVSGNGFGGIELGQGSGVTETVKITLSDNINIINTTESSSAPTMWVPADSDAAIVEKNGVAQTIQSGSELTLNEINNLFADENVENPQTGDSLSTYILSLTFGISSLVTTLVLLKKKNMEF